MRPIAKLLILFTLFFSTSAVAQDSKNGATWYRKAIKAYNALPRDFRQSIFNWNWQDPNEPITDEMRLAIAKIQPILRLARRGSNQQHSDFNLAYEEGIELLLPHLGSMRGITRFAMADVTIRLRDGDSATAAAELASMYRMSAHLNSDRMLISSLIGNAMFDISNTIAQTGLDNAAFDAVDSATMMEALNQFSDSDPFDYVEALTMEGEIVTDWLSRNFNATEDGGAMIANELYSVTSSDDFNGDLREKISEFTPDEFNESLDQVDTVMNRVVEAFMDPNKESGRAELDIIMKEIESGDHGALASMLMPGFTKVFDKMLIAELKLAERKAALALLLTGKITPEQGANAVVWYLRAITMLKEIEQEKRDQWKTFAIEADRPFDEEIIESLTDAVSIISIVREATQKARCDFAAALNNHEAVIPVYLPGFRELANLLIADANRLFSKGEADAAFDRLDLCLRMSAHLARDKTITSALVSHKIFALASAILQKPLTKAFLDDVHRVLIEEALDMMGRKDPFGYIAAFTTARVDVERFIWSKTIGHSAKDETLSKNVRKCQIDQLFAIQVIMWRGNTQNIGWPEATTDTLGPISDVLSLEALASVILQTAEFHKALKEKQYAAIFEKERPVISPLRQQLARARGDFRRAVLALKD